MNEEQPTQSRRVMRHYSAEDREQLIRGKRPSLHLLTELHEAVSSPQGFCPTSALEEPIDRVGDRRKTGGTQDVVVPAPMVIDRHRYFMTLQGNEGNGV